MSVRTEIDCTAVKYINYLFLVWYNKKKFQSARDREYRTGKHKTQFSTKRNLVRFKIEVKIHYWACFKNFFNF